MVVIKCRIIAKPRGGTRPIYKKGNDDKSSNKPRPLIRGKSGGRLTEKMEKQNKRLVSKNAIITTAILLTVFAVAGIQVLSIFGISIYSFMVAGGILLFIISIEFLTHGEWRYSGSSVSGDSGIVPLAFPLLAGPGAITTVMISLQAYGWVVSIISIVFVVLVTYLVLQ